MTRGTAPRLRLSFAAGLLLPLLALLVWTPTPASADTPSLGINVQVCTTAPQCYWETDADWASTVAVPSGQTVFWRVSITNTGDVALTNIVTNDAGISDCAGGVTAGPLQPGQVTAYSCQSDDVTAPTTNTASATGTPPSGPDVTSSTSSASVTTTSATVDPNASISALVQVCTLDFGPDCDPGNAADWSSSATVYNSEIWFRVVIINTGTDPLSNIEVISSLPPSESDCGGTATPSLAAGASYDYECELNNVTPPAAVTQRVWAAGFPPSPAPFVASPNSTATAQDEADSPQPGATISALLQICTLPNQASCDPTNAADWATSGTLNQSMARWRVVITNTGTVALTNIYAEDLLAQSDCGGFVTASLAVGATTEYECQTNNVAQTTTNSVSAAGDPPSWAPAISSPSNSTAVVNGFEQGATFETGPTTSTTVTLTGAVNAGDLLVGWVAEYKAAGQVTVSDNVNGAWTRSPASETFGGAGDIALLYLPDTATSSTGLTVTITAPAGAFLQGSIAEYTGVAESNPLDQFAVAEGNGTAVNAGPTGAVSAGELVYSAFVTGGDPGGVTPGSSQGVTFWPRAATASGDAYEQDIISSNPGTQTASATFNTATDWYAVVATFMPAEPAPSVPTGLATTSDTASSVGLRWNDSTGGATGYTVYRDGTEVGTTDTNSYTDSTVSPSTTYQYTVDAFNAGGTHSDQSSALSVTTPGVPPPSVPTGLATTSDTASSVGLRWNDSTGGATGYTVYRDGTEVGTTDTNSYTDSTVSPSTTYQYTVDAFNAGGTHSDQSSALSVTTPGVPPPSGKTTATSHGYWLTGSDGGVFSFGNARFHGSTGAMVLQRPVVGMVPTADEGGYWLDASDGGIFAFGNSQFYGSIPGLGLNPAGSGLPHSLNAPIVAVEPSIDDGGYFMVASDGGVFAFGDAHFAGSCPGIGGCAGAAVAVMPYGNGDGYWLVTATGNVYAFGDAPRLGAPDRGTVTSAVATRDGKGYWILLSDGEVFPYGDAATLGSPSSANFNSGDPATALFTTSDGAGYWVASALGAVFNYGDAPNDGGMSATHLNGDIIAGSGF